MVDKVVCPVTSADRKRAPVCTGVLDYFPRALVEISKLSWHGNNKHNPGEPLHWSRDKSNDHEDCLVRHLMDRGTPDPEMGGLSHTVGMAWRALAILELELEDKDNVDFIYIGFPVDVSQGTEPRIQLDDMLAPDYTFVSDWKQMKSREGKTPFDIVTSLKVHEDVGMRIVSDVKEELRDIDAIKINYSADAR